MRDLIIGAFVLTALAAATGVASRAAQTPASSAAAPQTTVLALPATRLEDALLEWPLPPGQQAYARIDGRHLHRDVEEQAAISRRYRDHGHPKFWGRIIGSSADAENAE
ncbi:MAG TPA: hypothetical protein VKD69_25010, partial [Vicinamibacterales bacterium]|nr:hypothetical protein [Vicinamibacterales bacterium]